MYIGKKAYTLSQQISGAINDTRVKVEKIQEID
jgi:hypothetical protein